MKQSISLKVDRWFCLLLLLLIPLVGIAQRPNPGDKSQQPTELEQVIDFGEEGYVLIMLNDSDQPSTMSLRLFDNEENLKKEKDIDLRRRGLMTQYEGAFAWDGELVVLTSLYYPGPKRNHLIFQRFSIPDFVEGDSKVVDEAYSPEQFRIPFGFNKSEDGNYMAVYSWTYTLPEDPAKLSIKVFNNAMEEVWTQRYLLPFTNDKFYIYECAVNKEGKVFIFCENYSGKPGRYIDESKINYFILGAEANRENMVQYELNLSGQTLTGLRMRLDKSGALIGAAFIRDAKKKSQIGGLYTFTIPEDGGSIKRSQMALTDDMYKAAYPYGEKEGIFNANRHRLTDFMIDHVFIEEDGSLVIAAEYRKELPNYYDIQFNDILVVKTSPDRNRIDWFKRIPKRQNGYQGAWAVFSYKAFQKKGNYFFIFNDNPDNHDQEGPPKNLVEYNGEKASILLMQVSSAGEVFKNDLTSLARKEKVAAIWPARVWEVSDKSRVMIYGDRLLGSGVIAGILFDFTWGPDLR